MSNLIRVAVIDDHPLFREGLVSILTSAGGFEIVGEGATTADALRIAEGIVPGVMLLEVRLQGGGIQAAAQIARVCPSVRIIMLTASEDAKDLTSALQVGVKGYILKRSTGQEVVETVRFVAQGHSYVAPNLAAQLLINKGGRAEIAVNRDPYELTSREAEVFGLLARGMSNKEIARIFKCTDRTVKHHVTNIMQKLNVRNRVQAAVKFKSLPFHPSTAPERLTA